MLANETIIIRLLIATLIGGIIGIEREVMNRPAGFRTHILVTLGSTLIMIISLHSAGTGGGDSARIAAQVVSGIGFLGAGSIIRSDGNVVGLTTAASIWVCGGLGLAIGSGMYVAAVVTAGLTLLSLFFNDRLIKSIYGKTLKERRYQRMKRLKTRGIKVPSRVLQITYEQDLDVMEILNKLLSDYTYKVISVKKFNDESNSKLKEIILNVKSHENVPFDEEKIRELSTDFIAADGLRSVMWKSK